MIPVWKLHELRSVLGVSRPCARACFSVLHFPEVTNECCEYYKFQSWFCSHRIASLVTIAYWHRSGMQNCVRIYTPFHIPLPLWFVVVKKVILEVGEDFMEGVCYLFISRRERFWLWFAIHIIANRSATPPISSTHVRRYLSLWGQFSCWCSFWNVNAFMDQVLLSITSNSCCIHNHNTCTFVKAPWELILKR